jgi:hypothetical protein
MGAAHSVNPSDDIGVGVKVFHDSDTVNIIGHFRISRASAASAFPVAE